jgi:hypothetical protein
MGITLTGDIILILKHAKNVVGKLATVKALEVREPPKKTVPVKAAEPVAEKTTKTITFVVSFFHFDQSQSQKILVIMPRKRNHIGNTIFCSLQKLYIHIYYK